MGQPHYKGTQAWHALSRDYIVSPATHAFIHECIIPAFAFPAEAGPHSSFTDPGRMEGRVGLGTTMVIKQSAQDRYVTEITVISCSDRHASPSNWKRSWLRASNSRSLEPKAAMLTTTPPNHPYEVDH